MTGARILVHSGHGKPVEEGRSALRKVLYCVEGGKTLLREYIMLDNQEAHLALLTCVDFML